MHHRTAINKSSSGGGGGDSSCSQQPEANSQQTAAATATEAATATAAPPPAPGSMWLCFAHLLLLYVVHIVGISFFLYSQNQLISISTGDLASLQWMGRVDIRTQIVRLRLGLGLEFEICIDLHLARHRLP